MTLGRAQAELQAALSPLGIEIGDEVLAVWRDREAHGADPLPSQVLRHAAAACLYLATDVVTADQI